MTRILAVGGLLAVITAVGAATASKAMKTGGLERGRYLVERAAMCGDCHTPRDAQGQPVEAQKLRGAPLDFRPAHPMPWAEAAPAIAGLPGMDAAQVTVLLQKGTLPSRTLRPPMPQYRLSQEDAEAVVAYLKSLGPATASSAAPSKATDEAAREASGAEPRRK